MKNSTVKDCKIINFKNQNSYINIQNSKEIPFEVKRIYFLYDIKNQSIRGEHAHKNLFQLIFGLNQGMKIKIDDSKSQRTFILNDPNKGLLIVPGIWRSLTEFFPESICLVLASELYSEHDYIRNYDEFLNFKK